MIVFENKDPSFVLIELRAAFDLFRQRGGQEALFIFHPESVITSEIMDQIIAEMNGSTELKAIHFVHPSPVLDFFLSTVHPKIPANASLYSHRDSVAIKK